MSYSLIERKQIKNTDKFLQDNDNIILTVNSVDKFVKNGTLPGTTLPNKEYYAAKAIELAGIPLHTRIDKYLIIKSDSGIGAAFRIVGNKSTVSETALAELRKKYATTAKGGRRGTRRRNRKTHKSRKHRKHH